MDYELGNLEPWIDSVHGRPIQRVEYSANWITIYLVDDELFQQVKRWKDAQ